MCDEGSAVARIGMLNPAVVISIPSASVFNVLIFRASVVDNRDQSIDVQFRVKFKDLIFLLGY
jgi:hypothetical protein